MAGSIRKPAQRARARFIVRPLFAALVASGIVAPAQGATIVVADGGDAGTGTTCTVRQAVDSLSVGFVIGGCVNSGDPFGTNDTVDLTLRTGTITLTAGSLGAGAPMLVKGPGPAQLTISGGGADRVFQVSSVVAQVALDGVTFANGTSQGPGGCIYASSTQVFLSNAVVTGCKATDDPASSSPYLPTTPFNGLGGGVFAYALIVENSTISSNTAQTAGGGVAAAFLDMRRTLVTGNTVLGETVDVANYGSDKYVMASTAAGGGGIVVAGPVAYLAYSVVSNNTVNATRFTGTNNGNNYEYRFGNGGGISHIGFKYTEPMLAPAGKSTIAGARPLFPRPTAAKVAEFRARAAALRTSPVAKAAALRPKADVPYGGLTLWSSTVSGNRVVGSGFAPNDTQVLAKYGGGGAAFIAVQYTAHIANSTISGNLLPNGGICYGASGPPPGNFFKVTCGAGLAGDSADITNTTITGNVGSTAVQFKYGTTTTLAPASAKSAILDSHPRLRDALSRAQPAAGATAKATMKAATSSDLVSTIVGANIGAYDIGCSNDCILSGSSNLVPSAQSTVTLPGGTLNANPQLAPLANRGGVAAGAPGILGTGPTPTHALYIGSPALNTGANVEGFTYDQRGPGFPRTVGAGTDIGAYEGAVPRPANSIPAVGPWMLGALSALLGALGLWRRRRKA